MKSLFQIVHEALQNIKIRNKPIFKTDLRTTGGTERDGGQSRPRGSDGEASYSGSGSGYSTKGQKGWSRSAKEFDIPKDSNPLDKSAMDETDELWDDPPVGLPVPQFHGNREPKPNYLGPRKR